GSGSGAGYPQANSTCSPPESDLSSTQSNQTEGSDPLRMISAPPPPPVPPLWTPGTVGTGKSSSRSARKERNGHPELHGQRNELLALRQRGHRRALRRPRRDRRAGEPGQRRGDRHQ